MRMLQRVADRLVGRLVPEVTASAVWYYQYECYQGRRCPQPTDPRSTWRRRYCHDSSGFCYDWENIGCCTP